MQADDERDRLDPGARRVVELARAARTPGDADKRRVRAALVVGLAASAGTVVGGAAVAKGALLGLRGLAAAVLVASAGTGAYVWLHSRAGEPAPASAPAPISVPPAPVVVPTPAPAEDPLLADVNLLQKAQRALRGGQPRVALELADRHAALYPSSQLALERGAVRVFALCALGRKGEARTLASGLLAAAPRSPLRTSLEESCAMK